MGGDGLHAIDEPSIRPDEPIARDQRPHDCAQALLLNEFAEPGAAESEGWAEPAGFLVNGLVDGLGATEQLRSRFLRAAEEEIGMSFRVVADGVAAGDDFFRESGSFTDVLADEEERRFGVITVEEIEELGSYGRIGAVVKGDGEFAGVAGLEEGVTEKLRAREDGTVCGHAGQTCNGDRCGNEQGIHRMLFCHAGQRVSS